MIDKYTHVDGQEKQTIPDADTDGKTRPKIRAASILDPFILVLREDDTLGLFVGDSSRNKIRRKDMSALGDKVRLTIFPATLPNTMNYRNLVTLPRASSPTLPTTLVFGWRSHISQTVQPFQCLVTGG